MKKLSKEKKVVTTARLIHFLDDIPDNEVDRIVSSAKALFLIRKRKWNKKYTKSVLVNLFDIQLQTLTNRGCSKAIADILERQRIGVISNAKKVTFSKGNIPFLPVIPPSCLSIGNQMSLVRNGNKVGYAKVGISKITDVVETPSKPYYIFDVEDGTKMLGKSPLQVERMLEEQKRSGLTDFEVISLCAHTNILSMHQVDAISSRYSLRGTLVIVPGVSLSNRGIPLFGWNGGSLNTGSELHGGASCGYRY